MLTLGLVPRLRDVSVVKIECFAPLLFDAGKFQLYFLRIDVIDFYFGVVKPAADFGAERAGFLPG